MYKYSDMVYEGKKLKDYCYEHNYDYEKLFLRLKYIFHSDRFNKLSTKEKIDLAIERYKNRDNFKYSSYIYKGKKLRDYCKENNIDMQYMYSRLIAYEKSNRKKFLPLDIKIQMAINCYNGINDFVYANMLYKDQKLSVYCRENGIKYDSIRNRICHDKRKGKIKDFPSEERIDLYIESYKRLDRIKKIKTNIELLKNDTTNNLDYKLIANDLNINYNKIMEFSDLSININKLMILTWYSADMKDDNGMYISMDKLSSLRNKSGLDINDLMGLFKAGNKDALFDIVEYEKYYVMGMVKKQLDKYNLIIPKYQYKELIDNITFELIKGINNSVMRYPGEIVNYIGIIVMYKTLEYIIQNIYSKSYSYIDEVGLKDNYDDYMQF